jgi:3-deoxy-manno-octulosonate cytidylyltransferase (CMP-KDO synthetase)
LAEACHLLGLDGDDRIVNLQGDEPLIAAAMIDACAELLQQRPDCVMSTVAHAIDDLAEFTNPNVVKVVLDAAQRALYFSRAPIGWWRDGFAEGITALPVDPLLPVPLRHVGLYGYRAGFLRRFPTLPPAPLERLESLEQLRVLWHGERIAVHVSAERPGPGVDTPDDLARVRALWPAA